MPLYLIARETSETQWVWRFGLHPQEMPSHTAAVYQREGQGDWFWFWEWKNDLVEQRTESVEGFVTAAVACRALAEFLEGDPNVDWWSWALRCDNTRGLGGTRRGSTG